MDSVTDIITVGVGESTLGFADLLTKCLQLGGESEGTGTPCKEAEGADIPARLKKVRQDYDRMLTVLNERATKAKILTVGYPTVIPKDTSKCGYGDFAKFGTITQGDLAWLRSGVLEPLNKAIEDSTAAQETASFVDLYPSSQDHSVCDDTKWVEGFYSFPSGQDPQISLVRPNALGHRNAAGLVEDAMLNALDMS
ncbi:SGNH/GDSL hydrolase family protein [Streptomyces violaceoruber]|uniref:SGNH/GDSL hydrolase family protein n=1 Tax=Streptomyces violaceoruber TaxID=1935 RepID=UPI00403C4653